MAVRSSCCRFILLALLGIAPNLNVALQSSSSDASRTSLPLSRTPEVEESEFCVHVLELRSNDPRKLPDGAVDVSNFQNDVIMSDKQSNESCTSSQRETTAASKSSEQCVSFLANISKSIEQPVDEMSRSGVATHSWLWSRSCFNKCFHAVETVVKHVLKYYLSPAQTPYFPFKSRARQLLRSTNTSRSQSFLMIAIVVPLHFYRAVYRGFYYALAAVGANFLIRNPHLSIFNLFRLAFVNAFYSTTTVTIVGLVNTYVGRIGAEAALIIFPAIRERTMYRIFRLLTNPFLEAFSAWRTATGFGQMSHNPVIAGAIYGVVTGIIPAHPRYVLLSYQIIGSMLAQLISTGHQHRLEAGCLIGLFGDAGASTVATLTAIASRDAIAPALSPPRDV